MSEAMAPGMLDIAMAEDAGISEAESCLSRLTSLTRFRL
jgi:hypothetical protein